MMTMMKKTKKMKKIRPRRAISVRLRESTIKDIRSLGIHNSTNLSNTLRFLIHVGFSNLGNWRKRNTSLGFELVDF